MATEEQNLKKRQRAPKKLKPGNKDGRPRLEIDMETLEGLCRMKPSLEDAAAVLKVSTETIKRRIKEETGLTFGQFRERYVAESRFAIIRTAMNKAKDGDANMIKYVLANISDWRDAGVINNTQVNVNIEGQKESPILAELDERLTGEREVIDVTPIKLKASDIEG